ncbi:MAG TPA: hypothetical protein VFZ21_15280 [Gemmatimonadaceae bacterium]|jgi:hypothetical protein|nr:hypothetical protein [Gemmatimonadaceae bacterium]
MRAGILLSALLLCLAPSLPAQATKPVRDVERFDLSGLPSTPTTDVERQILLFVKVHRKGDLTDATRIQMMLAQYYKQRGDVTRAEDCNRLAADAYGAAATAAPETAGASGRPPFEPQATFRRTFVYTDAQMIEHLWDFFADGTYSHSANGSIATGWYTRQGREMRLWQASPKGDRTVEFELVGIDGSEGALMAGVQMKPAS